MTLAHRSIGAGKQRGARALVALPVAIGGLGLGAAAFAQTNVASLSETVVTATRTEQRLSDAVADISVIDRTTIERSGAESVADVLAKVQGIQIARNGNPGNTTSVYLRGAETRFTAVFIDGVRIDSQATGGAPWEAIPLSQIDRIEIVRGPAAAVYGSDAMAGVIQFFTRKGEGPAQPYVGIGFGNQRTFKAEAGVSGASGGFDYSLGVSRDQSDGFDVRTPDVSHNPDKDDYRNTAGNVRLGFQINPQQRIEGTLLESEMKSGYDGFIYNPAAPVDDRNNYRLRAAGLNWSSQWTDVWRTKLAVTDSSNRYETNPDFYKTETQIRDYLFQNEFRFGPHLITADLERREDSLNNAPTEFSPSLDRERSQNGLALGYAFTQGAHTLQLNARHDDDSEFGGKNTGSAAYGYAFSPAWRATVSAGTSFRAPTLYQRFSEYGVANLQPEEGTNYEAGLRWTPQPASSLSLTVFHNKVKNLIDFDYLSTACQSFFGCFGNVGRAQYEGVTLAGTHRIGNVSLRGSVDWQDPRDLDTDKLLAQRARVYGSLGADVNVGTWVLGAEVVASGRRYADAANTLELGGYGLLNLTASTSLGNGLTLLARVDNATDKDYQLVRSYATAGRTFYVGLKWAPKI